MRMGRRFLELEADVGFEVWAEDLNSLFEEAALSMYEIMVDVEKVERSIERHISVSAPDIEVLLHHWLSELLFITDVERIVFSDFEVKISGNDLEGRAWGEFIDVERHNPKTEIKAVTYHKLSVREEGGVWRCTVVLDI
ncbi:archease [Candidatus Korarchaeum cryptofilum]|jgi:SHS2 domain-containing protein|uniref:Protein archease n=2 Tax=Candidatus Korarchaeum cryptofilum TaxID=498846 RepID=A0A3R9QA03_9CREN|nr:archease [Candidatus Korarchaeum cryptofilum]